jgi:hypothetical protein
MFIHFPQASEWLTGGVLWATPMIQVVGPNGKTHSFGVAMGSPTIEKHPCNCWWIYEWLWFMNCFQIGHRFRIFNGLVSGKIYRKPDQQWILVDFPFNKSTDSIPLNFPIYRWLSHGWARRLFPGLLPGARQGLGFSLWMELVYSWHPFRYTGWVDGLCMVYTMPCVLSSVVWYAGSELPCFIDTYLFQHVHV